MTITVTVKSDGSYTCDPSTKSKKKGKGKVDWVLATDGYHFIAPGVTWDTPEPATAPAASTVFTGLDVKATKITVDDDNQNTSDSTNYDYPYTLSIAADPPPPNADRAPHPPGNDSPSLEKSNNIIRNEPGD